MKNSKQQIAATWDKIASSYGAYRRKSWSAVSDFLSASKTPILDIGCGNASYAAHIKQKVIGLDLSFEMCKLASKNIIAIQADAASLPIKPKSFSRILSVATMHHLPTAQDRANYLAEIERVLKPGGSALITVWYRWQKKHLPCAIFTKNISLKWGSAKRYSPTGGSAELSKGKSTKQSFVISPILRYYHLFSKRELAKLASKVFNTFEIKTEQGTKYKNLYLFARK